MSSFRIKICGVRTLDDLFAVAATPADAIGLNFFAPSVRYVAPQEAQRLATACPSNVQRVGLFVNPTEQELRETLSLVDLDWVQLHGDEPPELLSRIDGLPIIKAFRVGHDGLRPVQDYLAECERIGSRPDAVLLDAAAVGQFGGTGKTLDWTALQQEIEHVRNIPWILAGGLTPDNVAEAIRLLRPADVDTASGVETTRGVKDPELIARFAAAANSALGGPAKEPPTDSSPR